MPNEVQNGWDRVASSWKRFSREAKKKWDKLTDDELTQVNGRRETLVGKIQEKYSVTKQEADKQIDEWARKLKG